MNNEADIRDWLQAVVEDVSKGTTDPLIVETEAEKFCWPHRFLINSKDRTVTCSRCSREFLPFDALDQIAKNWKSYNANLQSLKADIEHLSKVRNETRRRVQNLKAQLNRAESKGARKEIKE